MRRETTPLVVRFIDKVDFTGGPDDCWMWVGSLSGNGYGRIQGYVVDASPKLAHRVAYELVNGPIPEGMQLDHLCRNRRCVNPAHLEPVTCGENLRRGCRTRLTWAAVDEIRARRQRGESRRSVADRFDITVDYVTSITNGSKWNPSQHPSKSQRPTDPTPVTTKPTT